FVWLRLLLLTVVRVFVTHPPTTEIYTLSLHDALPIFARTAALDFGAVVANHARVVQLRHDDRGRCTGAVVAADGHRIEVRAAVVVNAAGVWADEVRGLDEGAAPDTIRPAKGVHITVPWEKVRNDIAVVVPVPKDRRSVFVVPWLPKGDGT